ncbi:TPA: restriction endonuclease subunit S [Vibrio metoecus]
MRSHYKRIGDYVTLVKLKNSDGATSSLKGININKHFMPSVANVNGTDLSTYRVVKKNQFAFNPMHVGRDEVLPISMLEDDEPIIVSPAYVVFEVKDEEELLPAYLMMWCRRSEFDRNAWFMTDNSVRGGFSWADFCDMELPVPSIEKQREIVREYNVVNDRIALNEQLTQKLDNTAQAIYKHWFVDFEFPISKEYAKSIGKPELEGKPYKSSGGEMCEEISLDTYRPVCWSKKKWSDISSLEYGKGLKNYKGSDAEFPVFGTNGLIGYTDRALVNSAGIIVGRKGVYRGVHYSDTPFYVIDTAFYFKPKVEMSIHWAFYSIYALDINGMQTGSAIPSTSRDDFYAITVIFPDEDTQESFQSLINQLNVYKKNLANQAIRLRELLQILQVKMTRVS